MRPVPSGVDPWRTLTVADGGGGSNENYPLVVQSTADEPHALTEGSPITFHVRRIASAPSMELRRHADAASVLDLPLGPLLRWRR